MKRVFTICSAAAVALTLVASLAADVKTREKTTFTLAGMLGRMANMFGGGGKDGIVSTVAVKGNRMSRTTDTTGQIVDLSEEKVYDLDIRKKEYKVTTFAELRRRLEEARAKAEKDMKDMPAEDKQAAEQAGKQLEFTADVKETGQRKSIAGYDARQVILTVTGHEKGKTVDEGGGFVMTNDMWLGPRIAALDEIGAFQMKYFRAVYGQALGIDPQQTAALAAMFPSFQKMAQQMAAEGSKMQGTPLFTTTTFESVKSPEQMQAAGSSAPASGGGLRGMLARKMAPKSQTQAKSTVMTTTVERLSIETAASADDVGIPAGFKEKK